MFCQQKTTDKNNHYKLKAKPSSILRDCSGVTFRPESKAYFVIDNMVGNIYEMNPGGYIEHMYPLRMKGKDTEGITYAGNNIFYICGEKENRIYEFLFENNRFVKKREVALKLPSHHNKNLEGIAFSNKSKTLFCVKEKNPPTLLEVSIKINMVITFFILRLTLNYPN